MKSNLNSKIENIYNNIQHKNQMLKESREKEIIEKIPEIKRIKKEISLNTISYLQKSVNKESKVDPNSIIKKNKILDNKISNLLKKNGYPKDYLELKYTCSKCHDKGYIRKGKRFARCSCYYYYLIGEFYKNSKYSLREDISFNEFNLNLFGSNKEYILDLKNDFENFVNNYSNKGSENFYLFGKTGVGKTFFLVSIAKQLLSNRIDALYLTATAMFDLIYQYKSSVFNNAPDSVLYDLLYRVNVLLIDDLGVESFSDSKYSEFLELINSRLNNSLSTIIASNLNPTDLCTSYDERAYSRIAGNYNIIKLDGNDLRLVKKRFNNQNQ